jgi:hypothetical protein
MKVHGGCHCGAISYEAEIDPEQVGICHCTDCQVLTGSVYRVAVPVARADFRLLSGRPRTYVKTADSGNRRRHSFCGDCGAPVHAAADVDDPPAYTLRVGCLRERAELRPRRQKWRRSALPWLEEVCRLPATEGQ